MDWFVKAFVKASVIWLPIGVILGVGMASVPAGAADRGVCVRAMLLGFVTMFISGVAYHVLPRFCGRPLWSARAAHWHWWLGNAAVCVMVAGFWLPAAGLPSDTIVW